MNFLQRVLTPKPVAAPSALDAVLSGMADRRLAKESAVQAQVRNLAVKVAVAGSLGDRDQSALEELLSSGAVTDEDFRKAVAAIRDFKENLARCVDYIRKASGTAAAYERVKAAEKELQDARAKASDLGYAEQFAGHALASLANHARGHRDIFGDLNVRELAERLASEPGASQVFDPALVVKGA